MKCPARVKYCRRERRSQRDERDLSDMEFKEKRGEEKWKEAMIIPCEGVCMFVCAHTCVCMHVHA